MVISSGLILTTRSEENQIQVERAAPCKRMSKSVGCVQVERAAPCKRISKSVGCALVYNYRLVVGMVIFRV